MSNPQDNPTNSANSPSDEPIDIGETARHRHAHTEGYPLSDEQALAPKEKYEEEQRAKQEAYDNDPDRAAKDAAATDAPPADEPVDPAPVDPAQPNVSDLA